MVSPANLKFVLEQGEAFYLIAKWIRKSIPENR